MAKVQKLSDIQQEIAFTEFDFYLRYEESFKTTELGRIKCLLPLREMAISFGLIEEKPNNFRPKRGRKSFFTPKEEAFSFMAASMLFPLVVQTAFTLRVSVRETDWSAVKKIGGDQGYSGNDNRTFCKENKIETSFTQKGRSGKNEIKNATKRELARVRATAMEGSFGTQKEHYGLRKLAARIKSTEIMLIFFGIHTANAVNLARRESVQVALAA